MHTVIIPEAVDKVFCGGFQCGRFRQDICFQILFSGNLICGGIVFEYFSYGFGFVGLTLFIMQQVAPGPHKMAHYAFGSSLANLGVMLPGMASGWLCDQVGYHRFFLWALMATIPIFLIAWRIPFAHPDTEEGAAQAVEKELTDE